MVRAVPEGATEQDAEASVTQSTLRSLVPLLPHLSAFSDAYVGGCEVLQASLGAHSTVVDMAVSKPTTATSSPHHWSRSLVPPINQ